MSLAVLIVVVVLVPLALSRWLRRWLRPAARVLIAASVVPAGVMVWLLSGSATSQGDREAQAYGIGGALVLWLAGGIVATLDALLTRSGRAQ